jgi:hypothetical protein
VGFYQYLERRASAFVAIGKHRASVRNVTGQVVE